MRKKIVIFIAIVSLILIIVPAINIFSGNRHIKIKSLYNVDFVMPYISKALYSYGINIFSDQVVIGENNWLFLGDNYAKTITLARQGVDVSYAETANVKNNSLYDWNHFFFERGVKDFKILVGPNKSSIYSEFLPRWIKLSDAKKIDMLMKSTNDNYYIYPKKELLAAKQSYIEHELYYKTDTHWNNLGGWIAFDYFIKKLKKDNSEINYNKSIYLKGSSEFNRGDLSSFLRLSAWLKDKQPDFDILPVSEVKTECKKFYTDESYSCDGNPELKSPQEPLLVMSKGAENTKKVLWLRDSFGIAISPYMAILFSDVVQVHYANVDKEKLIDLVEKFDPDYVLMTIVERGLDGGLPNDAPQIDTGAGEVKSYSSQMILYNDIEEKNERFSIRGNDPYLVYKLDRGIDGKPTDSLALNLACDNDEYRKKHVDIQVFWKASANDNFSELSSGKYSVAQGRTYVELGSVSNWVTARNVQYLRLDIEPASFEKCTDFNINNLIVNKIQ